MESGSLPVEGRILAIDLGKRRVGLALSDPLRLTAQGIDTLYRTRIRDDMDYLGNIVLDRGVSHIIIGNPLHMSGREGRQSAWVHEFADRLAKHTGIAVELWDERLTSREAERVLRSSGISIDKRAKAVDRLAAMILLESYLDYLRLGAPLETRSPEIEFPA